MNQWATGMRTALISGSLLCAGALGTVALAGSDASPTDVPTRVVQVKSDPAGSPLTMGPLTARQKRQARRILARDKQFRRIVDPSSYRLGRIVPWGVSDRRKRQHPEVFIGTTMEAVLDTSKPSVVARFLLVDYPDVKRPAYRIRTFQLTVRGLRSVSVLVDLKRRKVAGLSPSQADEVIYPPGYKPRPPSGA